MPDTVKAISVVLPQATLTVGASMAVSADVTTNVPDGAVDPQVITWTSSNLAVATLTVSATGAVVKGVAAGSAVIRAAVGTVAGSASLTVAALMIDITAAQLAAITAIPVGASFSLKGPVAADGSFVTVPCQKN